MRIGLGYDVHRLTEGRKLIIGGVNIPYQKGLSGHSDADVLIHAVIDAILGALAKGDIGTLFPDNDDAYKDIDSRILLHDVYQIIDREGFEIGNLDATICAEKPKMKDYIMSMRNNLADDLQCSVDRISIKATTEEKLGFTGREEGISAQAIVLLKDIS